MSQKTAPPCIAERFYYSIMERRISVKARILCLCLALALFVCGCSKSKDASPATDSTTTTTQTTTDTTVSTTLTHTESSTVHTTTETTSIAPDHTSTTSGSSVTSTTTNSTTGTTSTTSTHIPTSSSSASTTMTTAPNNTITFKATIRDSATKRPISGIGVSVWSSPDVLLGSGYTDQNGIALISVPKHTTYRVTLHNLQGYEAAEKYLFSTNTVNITLRKAAVQNEQDHSQAQYDEGKTMTDFSLTDTEGNTYRLSNLLKEKKLVILDFWFTSCEPCKKEFPFFEAAVQKYGDDVALLAIDPIDSVNAMVALRNQLNSNPNTAITFPMLKDTCNLFLGFDVTSYPTTVFIDSNGVILDVHTGAFPTEAALFAAIEKYLP